MVSRRDLENPAQKRSRERTEKYCLFQKRSENGEYEDITSDFDEKFCGMIQFKVKLVKKR
jgi:hypothetical protein